MSSILTNTSAMVALQTLGSINKNLGMTQAEISTGKSVATAKDNASVWAIAQTMTSDVEGFNGISDALATGSSNVAVARTAAETVTDLLTQVKEKVVAAQDPAADSTKLMADVTELTNQINSVVGAAQFNGVNLVDGQTPGGNITVLSSIDRDSAGNVTPSYITVTGQDLSTTAAGTLAGAVFSDGGGGTTFTVAGNGEASVSVAAGGDAEIVLANLQTDDTISFQLGSNSVSYQVTAADMAASTPEDVVAVKIKALIDAEGITGLTVDYNSANPGELVFDNSGTGAADMSIVAQATPTGTGNLAALTSMSAGTLGTAATLQSVEGMITNSIDAAAALGSSQKRIDIQSDFVGKLTDSLKAGIGALVDANMEEASAKLQALQVQQQLGIQSLSIANQAPQQLLSLFR